MPAMQRHGASRLPRLRDGGHIQDALYCVSTIRRLPDVPWDRAEVETLTTSYVVRRKGGWEGN